MILLIIAALIAAAVVLCGYTTARLPVRREEGKQHIACVGDSVTYGCTLPTAARCPCFSCADTRPCCRN